MAKPDPLVASVLNGPSGPDVGAFFDYDGTVIDGYSVAAFYRHRLRQFDIGPLEAARTLLAGLRGTGDAEEFASFFDMAMQAWAGRSEDEMEELGERLFRHDVSGSLYPEAWRLVEAHRSMGHTIVLASSATSFQVAPMARALGVEHVLCSRAEVEDGILTGRAAGPLLWGQGKADAVRDFAAEHDVELWQSYAYSNGTEDVPFLETVGYPCAVNPEEGLARLAAERGWPLRKFSGRGRPGLRTLARSAAAYGGMAAGASVGVGLGLLNRSRRTAVDMTGSIGSELGLALAGIDVRVVRGEEHLVRRPAVFVFNHQSPIDVLVISKLLRGGFTGVAKKEAASIPGFGQFFRLAGVAFVDRGNTEQAKAALAPAVARLQEGISLAMAPEGTRSPTPRLGRFKKGAFHIAMQAQVPIVPIVIRNAGEVMWRGSKTMRSGTIEVVVHPPISVEGWTVEKLDERVRDLQRLYEDTLEDWPGTGTARSRPRVREKAGTR